MTRNRRNELELCKVCKVNTQNNKDETCKSCKSKVKCKHHGCMTTASGPAGLCSYHRYQDRKKKNYIGDNDFL